MNCNTKNLHCHLFFSAQYASYSHFFIDNDFVVTYNADGVIVIKSLGERLRHARKSKGYTQESLAKAIGASRGVIFNLEKDKTVPQPIVVNALCQTLRVAREWLELGVGEMEDAAAARKSAKVLFELYEVAGGLSEAEQLYLLDTIRAMKQRLGGGDENR